jgi:hypothetical protein
MIDSFPEVWLAPLILGGIGTVVTIFCLGNLLFPARS